MKRIFTLYILILGVAIVANSQLSVVGNHVIYKQLNSVVQLVVFESMDNITVNDACKIHFKSEKNNETTRWYVYENGTKKRLFDINYSSNKETFIEPKHHTGYLIESGGEQFVFWVIDRSQLIDKDHFEYQSLQGELTYYSLREDKQQGKMEHLINFSDELDPDDDEEEILSCKIITKTTMREALNENQRPSENSVEGSSPLHIEFIGEVEGEADSFLWTIYKEGEQILTRSDQNIEFTFEHSGKYMVSLRVANEDKSASDSIYVDVSESQIIAPSVFTPNGDGVNDEFRVAYTSISEFQATIINRWGRTVFSWSDPQKGWNGTINGKPAPEGTYFYIIKAVGADNKPYFLKGHLNLLR